MLKRCPCCSGNPVEWDKEGIGVITCTGCLLTIMRQTIEEARNAWNRRAERWIPVQERLPGPEDGVGREKTVIGLFRDTQDYFPASWHFIVENKDDFTHWWTPPAPPSEGA